MVSFSNIPSGAAVVVTGATGGIGRALVTALYAAGVPHIIAACRCPDRMAGDIALLRAIYPSSASEVHPVALDLSSIRQARQGARNVIVLKLPIFAVLNNAGTMPVDRLEVSPDGVESTLQVNCLSTLAFTFDLVPDIMPGGVVVFTSSVMRKFPSLRLDFDTKALCADNIVRRFNNYGRSKLLLTLSARVLADDLAKRDIRVNCADPGVVDTGIINLGYRWVDDLADTIARPFMRSPERGAEAALRAMASPFTGRMCTPSEDRPLRPLTATERTVAVKALRMAAGQS